MSETKHTPGEIIAVMNYIIQETRWAVHFPEASLDRIRQVCEAVKAGEQLPFHPQEKENK